MKNIIFNLQIIGTIVIIVLGTLFHFTYDFFGKNIIVGLFTPVNESVWEHLKLVLWPTLIFSIAEYHFIGSSSNNFAAAKAASIITAILLIVLIFYTYTALIGHNSLLIDILTFTFSVIAGQFVSCIILSMNTLPQIINKISVIVIAALIIIFAVFTIFPPHLPIFMDSLTGKYGIKAK